MRRLKRILGKVVGVALVLILAVRFGANAVLNTQAAHDRIVAAIERATGHQARIDGPIAVAWSLEPAFSIEDVAILNQPGFSRPALATAHRVEARVAVLPLLQGRIELPGLWIDDPDIRLERNAAGLANWVAAPPSNSDAAPSPSPQHSHTPVEIGRVQLVNGIIAWQDAPTLHIHALQLIPGGGPLSGSLTVRDTPFELVGSTWPATVEGIPFEATAVGGGLALAASGHAGGAKPEPIAFEAKTADLSALSPLAGRPLPPLRDVVLTGQLTPAGLAGLHLAAGPSDLGALVPGLSLAKLGASLAGLDQPIQIEAQAALRTLPIAIAANVGPRAPATPIQLQLTADGATLGVQASLDGSTVQWTEATIAAHVPNLGRTATLAGIRAPGLRDAAIDVRLQPTPTGTGLLLRGLRVTSAQGDVAGDLALALAPRPSLKGSLISQRLDLDAWTKQPKPPKQAPESASEPAPGPAPAATPAAATAPSPPKPRWSIPDRPLPFAALKQADADLRWSAAALVSRGVTYRSATLHILLQDGRLRIDPAILTAPGGPVQAALDADASATPPTAALTIHAPNIDAAAVAAAAGVPGGMSGALDLDIALHATGATPHQLAATATGHAGLALTDGEIENATLATLFAPALHGAGIPVNVFAEAGSSRVACLAIRLDATDGQATVKALALNTSKLRLDGDGTLDLASETMDLHLRPTIRLGPTSVAIPVHLAGPWRTPKAANDRGVIAPGRFGIAIGAATPDPCGPALAEVRAP